MSDRVTVDGMQTTYFPSRKAARDSAAARNNGFTLRRVNLEDAFLSWTGKKAAGETDDAKTIHAAAHGDSTHGHHSHGHGSHGTHTKEGD